MTAHAMAAKKGLKIKKHASATATTSAPSNRALVPALIEESAGSMHAFPLKQRTCSLIKLQ